MHTQFSIYLPERTLRRIDLFLSHTFPELSRAYIHKLIETGNIRVNGKILGDERRVKLRDVIDIDFQTEKYYLEAENIPLEVIFENSDFAIISKDAGMNTHTFPWEYGKTGTLLNALLYHFGDSAAIGGVERPGIVHRLDKDTSGLIIIAKNDRSMKEFQKQIAARKIRKIYYAVVVGIVKEKEGLIESYIGNDSIDHKKMTTKNPLNPKLARTKYRCLEYIDDRYSLLEIELFTGRTHQIRVHMADMGHPIVGDKVYGDESINREVAVRYWLARQWLHARRLIFTIFSLDYDFIAPLKSDIAKMLRENGLDY